MALPIDEFQKRLESISEVDGVQFARLATLRDAENAHEQAVSKFWGHRTLSDAFKCFYLETVELGNTAVAPKVTIPLSANYPRFVPRIAVAFQGLCGAECAAQLGYPYQGYGHLRNIFDELVLTSAALQKLTDFDKIDGIDPSEQFDPSLVKKIKRKRMDNEFEVRQQMTGKKSGLKPESVEELAMWDALFDWETHGARLSAAQAMAYMKGTEPLPIVPKFKEGSYALFMNRFSEIGWMLHRLLPALQPPDVLMPDAWHGKWQILDESFEQMVYSLTAQSKKKIGEVMVEFVKAKFPFHAKSAFPL
ncbi:hypothetical protein BWI17_16330 [Betaproteobacteria bacterium GR16-43]|nr:hypothetical protein BWI17_16330 [Betaproteobacteria bacterium GR16-43]